MAQRWELLLFAHWPVDPSRVQPHVGLPLDTHDGEAWLTVTPHRISGVHLRGMPALPRLSMMLEVSIRTYVRAPGRAGVVFLSLDMDSRLGVWAARRLFSVRYDRRPLSLRRSEQWVHFESPRFAARYRPRGETFAPQPGSLDAFLHERDCLFTPDGRRIDVHGRR